MNANNARPNCRAEEGGGGGAGRRSAYAGQVGKCSAGEKERERAAPVMSGMHHRYAHAHVHAVLCARAVTPRTARRSTVAVIVARKFGTVPC